MGTNTKNYTLLTYDDSGLVLQSQTLPASGLAAQTLRVWDFGLVVIVLRSPTSSEFTLALLHEKWACESDVTHM